MTVRPRAPNSSIRAAAAPWGRARKTASASSGTASKTRRPSVARCGWMPASGSPCRSRPTSPTIVALGCLASSRTSSAPTYPVAPTIATRTGSPSMARSPAAAAVPGAGVESRGRSAAIAAPVESALTGARGRSPAAGSGDRRSGGTSSPHDYTGALHSHATTRLCPDPAERHAFTRVVLLAGRNAKRSVRRDNRAKPVGLNACRSIQRRIRRSERQAFSRVPN